MVWGQGYEGAQPAVPHAQDPYAAADRDTRAMVAASWWATAPAEQRRYQIAARMLTLPDGSWWLFGADARWYRCNPADGQWYLCPAPKAPAARASARPLQHGQPSPQVPPELVPAGPDFAYDPPRPATFLGDDIPEQVTARVRAMVESAGAVPSADYPHRSDEFSSSAPSTIVVTWGVMLWCAVAPVFQARHDEQLLGYWAPYRASPLPPGTGPRWFSPPTLESLVGVYAERLRAGRVDAAVTVLRTMWATASALREDLRFRARADALLAVLGATLNDPSVDYNALSYGDPAIVQQWIARCPRELAPAMRVEASAGEYFRGAFYDLGVALRALAGEPGRPGYVEPRMIAASLLGCDLSVVRSEVAATPLAWLDPDVRGLVQSLMGQSAHPLRRLWPDGGRLPGELPSLGTADAQAILATMYAADLAWCRLCRIPARPRGFPVPSALAAEIGGAPRASGGQDPWAEYAGAYQGSPGAGRADEPRGQDQWAQPGSGYQEPWQVGEAAPSGGYHAGVQGPGGQERWAQRRPEELPQHMGAGSGGPEYPAPGSYPRDPGGQAGPYGQDSGRQAGRYRQDPGGQPGPYRQDPGGQPGPYRQDPGGQPGPYRQDSGGQAGPHQQDPGQQEWPAAHGMRPPPGQQGGGPAYGGGPAPREREGPYRPADQPYHPPDRPHGRPEPDYGQPPAALYGPAAEAPPGRPQGPWPPDEVPKGPPGTRMLGADDPADVRVAGGGEPPRQPPQPQVGPRPGTRIMSETMVGDLLGAPLPEEPPEPPESTAPAIVERYGIRFVSGPDDLSGLLDDLLRRAAILRDPNATMMPPPSVLVVGKRHSGERRLARLVARALGESGDGDGSVSIADAGELRGDILAGMAEILDGGGDALLIERFDNALDRAEDPVAFVRAVVQARRKGKTTVIATCTAEAYEEITRDYPTLAQAFRVFQMPDFGDIENRMTLLHVLADERGATVGDEAAEVARGDLGRLKGRGDAKAARLVEAYLERGVARNREHARAAVDRHVLIPEDFAGVADELEPAPSAPGDIDLYLSELDQMTGLEGVKETIEQLVGEARLEADRAAQGLTGSNASRNLIFLGRLGTGKETVARVLGGIYAALGLLDTGHIVQIRPQDLVSRNQRETEANMAAEVERAMGGVLLIDDAAKLDRSPALTAELLRLMTGRRDKFMVVSSSMPEEMDGFLAANPGFRAEFGAIIEFREPTDRELVQLFQRLAERDLYMLDEELRVELLSRFSRLRDNPRFTFADSVREIFEQTVARQAARLSGAPASAAVVARLGVQDLPESTLEQMLGNLHRGV